MSSVNWIIQSPVGLTVDSAGNLFIADREACQVLKVRLEDGDITRVAGTGEAGFSTGFSHDGDLAAATPLNFPSGVAVDAAGNLFIVDTSNRWVFKVGTEDELITGLVGNSHVTSPYDVVVDAAGNLFISDLGTGSGDSNHKVLKVHAEDGRITITTAAGTGEAGFSGDGGPAEQAQLKSPGGLAVDTAGNLYIADSDNHRVRKVSADGGIITTVAGTGERGSGGDDGLATWAQLSSPIGVAIDAAGALFIAETGRVRKVDKGGIITTFAGTGKMGFSGDGGPAEQAQLNSPSGLAFDSAGNLFIADTDNQRVRRIDTNKVITTAVGIAKTADGAGDAPTARPFQKANIDRPAARMAHRLATMGGDMPSRRMRVTSGSGSATAGPYNVPVGSSAGLHHNNPGWISLGPHQVGGRTRAILFDPTKKDHTRIYAGAASGGVWRSEDRGQTWFPTENFMGNLAVASLAIDGLSKTVFAGTGELIDGRGGMPGEGIFFSKDGWSWELIEDTRVTRRTAMFAHVSALAMTKDGKALLAGTGRGLCRFEFTSKKWKVKQHDEVGPISTLRIDPKDDSRLVASRMDGPIHYSIDGGKSWKPSKLPATDLAATRVSLCYARENSNIVYALKDAPLSGQIWRSTDGGQTFRYWGDKKYFGTCYDSKPKPEPVSLLGGQGSYDCVIWADDPHDAGLVVTGGVKLHRIELDHTSVLRAEQISPGAGDPCHDDHHVMVSDPAYDGTKTSKPRLWVGNDGGIYSTEDINTRHTTVTWKDRNRGYGITQFYHVAANPKTRTVIAGAQDNGTRAHTSGEFFWDESEVTGGDGGYVAADPVRPDVFYGEYVFGSVQRADRTAALGKAVTWDSKFINGTASITNDSRHISWKHIKDWIGKPFEGFYIPESYDDTKNHLEQSAEFIAPFVLDPEDKDGKVMLVGCSSLWRSINVSDPPLTAVADPKAKHGYRLDIEPKGKLKAKNKPMHGPKWKAIKPDWDDGTVTALATAKSHEEPGAKKGGPPPKDKGQPYSNVILVGHSSGAIYVTTNANFEDGKIDPAGSPAVPSWKRIPTPLSRRCNCLAIDPKDPERTFYAGFASFWSSNLWKTTNGGTSWEDISGGAPVGLNAPIYAVTLHPLNHQWVYVGTEMGVFSSEDGGRTWAATNEGPANVPCYGFTWIGNTLLVATYGRGVFQIDLTMRPPSYFLFVDRGSDHHRRAGTDYRPRRAGTLYRIDAKNYTSKNKFTTPGSSFVGDFLLVDEEQAQTISDGYGKVYKTALSNRAFLGDDSGKVYCVDPAKLDMAAWTMTLSKPAKVHVAPALWVCSSLGSVYLLVVTDAGNLHLLDPSKKGAEIIDPKKNWPVSLGFGKGEQVWSCEVMDDWAFITTTRGTYAVRCHPDAQVGWHHEKSHSNQPPLMVADSCFVSGSDGKLYALKSRADLKGPSKKVGEDQELWPPKLLGASKVNTRPVWLGGAVIAGNEKGQWVGVGHLHGEELFKIASLPGRPDEIQDLTAHGCQLYWVGTTSNDTLLNVLDVLPGYPTSWSATHRVQYRVSDSINRFVVADQVYLISGSEVSRDGSWSTVERLDVNVHSTEPIESKFFCTVPL